MNNLKKEISPLDREQFLYLTGVKSPFSLNYKSTQAPIAYTYIMRSLTHDNLYKFGRTKNLYERVKSLNGSPKFKKYHFVPFAYSPCDREHSILFALKYANVVALYSNPNNNRVSPEAYFLQDSDVRFIMELFHFRLIESDNVPSEITLIENEYKDVLGRIKKVEYYENIEHGTVV